MFLRRLLLPIIVLTVVSACGGVPTPQNSSSPLTTPLASSGAPTAGTVPTMPSAPTTLIAPTQALATLAPATPAHTGFAKKIDIGGRALFMTCIGAGSPTVLLEANMAGDSMYWADVLRGVGQITRVCDYDRAGAGQSDPVPGPRSAHQLVEDLHSLLKNAGVGGPYVLVGHSCGGELVRLYASEHPADAAGMVLVDGWPDGFDAGLLAIVPAEGSAWLKFLSQVGNVDILAVDAEMSRAAALPQIPLLVLTAHSREDLWSELPLPADKIPQVEQLWLTLQQKMVHIVPDGTQVIATSGDNCIQCSQPSQVITAITTVVNKVRRTK